MYTVPSPPVAMCNTPWEGDPPVPCIPKTGAPMHKLVEDFPVVFNGKSPYCGIGYGDGWDPVLRELCTKLTEILKEPGLISVGQIKEKFGGLRFYADPEYGKLSLDDKQWAAVEEAITEAERKADKICERCGAPGVARDGGWVRTLCDGCHK